MVLTGKKMNKLKLSALALSSVLVWGCGSSEEGGSNENSNQQGTFSQLLEGGYWEFGSVDPVSEDDLPNVYVLEGNQLTYYYDDDNLGTYTAYSASFQDDSAGNFTFDYYDNSITPIQTTISYTIVDGVLTIYTELDELVDYQDHAGDSDVLAAINAAENPDNGGSDDEDDSPVLTDGDSDTFEGYSVGDLISEASSDWSTLNIEDDANGTTTAEVSDAQAKDGDNSLFLEDSHSDSKPYAYRTFTGGAQTAGSVSIDVYLDGNNSDRSFIQVGSGPWDDDRYFQLRLKTALEYEAGDDDVELASLTQDTWHTVTMSWTDAGLFTISLNGEVVGENIDQAATGLGTTNIPTHFVVYTGSKSGTGNKVYFDNVEFDLPETVEQPDLEIPSLITDDFESYDLGEELPSPWEDYGSSGEKATIVEDAATWGQQALSLYDTTEGSKSYAMRYFASSVETGEVIFYLKVADSNDQSCYVDIMSGTNTLEDIFAGLKITTSGNVYYEAGDSDVKLTQMSLGVWHKFTMSWTATAFSIALDNVVIANDIAQSSTGLTGTTPELIRFMAGTFSATNTSCIVDDVYSASF